jgi:hypothetical protein
MGWVVPASARTTSEEFPVSQPFEASQGYELRDPAGVTVGVFVPAPVLPALTAERDALRARVTEQAKQLAALREELDRLRKERDEYQQALECVSRDKSLLIDQGELADLERNGVPFADIVGEIEKMLEDARPGA